MKPTFERYRAAFRAWYGKLSKRERHLLSAPLIVVALLLVYVILYRPVASAFAAQRSELAEADLEIKRISALLDKYTRLRAKRQEIENQYREIEIKEGGLTLLENLIRTKLDAAPGSFTIKERDNPSREFGGNYEQQPFNVRFNTTDLGKLVYFLQEMVHGPKPLILRKIDIRRRGERLEVDLDVSSIRRIRTP